MPTDALAVTLTGESPVRWRVERQGAMRVQRVIDATRSSIGAVMIVGTKDVTPVSTSRVVTSCQPARSASARSWP